MPATVSYVKITPKSLIQIRVFVNRKKILTNNTVAINDRLLLKLQSINSLRLSNNDLGRLIEDIKEDLQKLLFEDPLSEVFPGRSVNKATKTSRECGNSWKCNIVVLLGYVANLRYRLGHLKRADAEFVDEQKVQVTAHSSNKTGLLEKETSFSFAEDEKKLLSYTLRPQNILATSVTDGLDVYVWQRPKT